MKKTLLTILIILLVIVLVIVGAVVYFYISKLNQIEYVDIPKNEIEVSEEVQDKLTGYRNIVLFGIDDADGYVGRSDCIIIFSLNQETNKVKMTSVYRDTYVEVPNHGYTKINHAYAYGGAALAMSTINRNLDLNITEFVTINFEVVKDVVDAIGGVEITVTDAEANEISGISEAGTYNLTGKQALSYGRIRHIDTDYKRTERMRNVISKVFDKAKDMSITELNDLLDKILPEAKTNIQKAEITQLLTKATSFEIEDSIGWPYEVSGKMISGVFYAVPKTLKSSVEKLHQELFADEEYQTTKTVDDISSTIVEKTGVK